MDHFKQEIFKILSLVESQKTTAAQGMDLLEAVGAFEAKATKKTNLKGRFLRIYVDSKDGNPKEKVRVSIPLALARFGLKLAKNVTPKYSSGADALANIDIDEIMEAIESMSELDDGVDIMNVEADDKNVRICVE